MATIPSRKATFTEEEKRKLVEGTDAQGKPLSESEKMKLSKMHTARTLGADWREKAAERMKAEEPARAQQALEERAAINRSLTPREYKLPTKAEEWQTLPGGGMIKIGAETLKRAQGFEKERAGQEQARQEKFQKGLASVQQEAKAALRKRYEDELAARGFAPPKTRQEQEAIDRAKMDEFRLILDARNAAREKERNAAKDYKIYNALAKAAEFSGDRNKAEELSMLAEGTGGQFRNQSDRSRFLENKEMMRARALIDEKTKARKAKMQAQNTSNPEAAVSGSGYKDFISGVNQESPFLTYQNIAGIYGNGANPFSKYVKKAKGPEVKATVKQSPVKAEATALDARIKQIEDEEAIANIESTKNRVQEIEREIAKLSSTTTQVPVDEFGYTTQEIPKDKKTLLRDRKKIEELRKLKKSLNK